MKELLFNLVVLQLIISLCFVLLKVKFNDLQKMAFFTTQKTLNEEPLQSLPFQQFLHRHYQVSILIVLLDWDKIKVRF
jgi:hypothetical protein